MEALILVLGCQHRKVSFAKTVAIVRLPVALIVLAGLVTAASVFLIIREATDPDFFHLMSEYNHTQLAYATETATTCGQLYPMKSLNRAGDPFAHKYGSVDSFGLSGPDANYKKCCGRFYDLGANNDRYFALLLIGTIISTLTSVAVSLVLCVRMIKQLRNLPTITLDMLPSALRNDVITMAGRLNVTINTTDPVTNVIGVLQQKLSEMKSINQKNEKIEAFLAGRGDSHYHSYNFFNHGHRSHTSRHAAPVFMNDPDTLTQMIFEYAGLAEPGVRPAALTGARP